MGTIRGSKWLSIALYVFRAMKDQALDKLLLEDGDSALLLEDGESFLLIS